MNGFYIFQAPQVPGVTPDTMFEVDPEPPPLPPSCCANLVTTIPSQSLWSLSQLLSSLLVAEVEGIPRGTITSAVRQSTVVGSLERAVGGLGNMVQGMCLANAVRDLLYGMVASKTVYLFAEIRPTHIMFLYSVCTLALVL